MTGEMKGERSLDTILAEPGSVNALSRKQIEELLAQTAAVQCALTSRLVTAGGDSIENARATSSEPDVMLTVVEVAARLRREPRWIYRQAAKLPFVRRISRRSILCSQQGLERWLANRKT
jgi:hypothetical protein